MFYESIICWKSRKYYWILFTTLPNLAHASTSVCSKIRDWSKQPDYSHLGMKTIHMTCLLTNFSSNSSFSLKRKNGKNVTATEAEMQRLTFKSRLNITQNHSIKHLVSPISLFSLVRVQAGELQILIRGDLSHKLPSTSPKSYFHISACF